MKGRAIALSIFVLAGLLAACGSFRESTGTVAGKERADTFRIGYQKYGTMNILKTQGSLERALSDKGIAVRWTEFPGGPQLLEALNVGSIDIGHTGEAPPIFAQAAGAPLVYLAHEPPSPGSEAILVRASFSIQRVGDLKGKKVALNKGSNVHYLLVKLLEKAGLRYDEIELVYLPPSDARAAFERGSVDAWVIWDPFFAAAESADVRVLADGRDAVSNHEFYLASRPYAESHPDVIAILLDELDKVDRWASDNPTEVAERLSPQLGIDAAALERAAKRRAYGIRAMDDQVVAEQQSVADAFYRLGLIPNEFRVRDAIPK